SCFLALVGYAWQNRKAQITNPSSNEEVYVGDGARGEVTVSGFGGNPLLYHYVIVAHLGEAWVQQCREFHPDYLDGFSWSCPVFVGDEETPSKTKFQIYIIDRWHKLLPGEDFDVERGVLY